MNPNDADAYSSRGILYWSKLGRHESALADFESAIMLDPTDELTFLMRGSLHDELGNYQKAKEDFEKVLSLAPNQIYTEYGDMLFETSTYRILGFDKNLVPKHDPRQSADVILEGLMDEMAEIETMLSEKKDDSDIQEENRLIEHELANDREDFTRSTEDGWFYSDEEED